MKKIHVVCSGYKGVTLPFTVGNIVRSEKQNETAIIFEGTFRSLVKTSQGFDIVYTVKNSTKIHFMRLHTDQIKYLTQLDEKRHG